MHCFDPVHLVAPDGEDGLVDGPGVGVEADTDLQGNVWVKTRLLSDHHRTLASYPHTCPCV